ncbi:hypothetical protein KUCAC02_024208 [Chaenocephalus aceratus]|uniref:Uncharacterized protein n=1 Tax=Chaenocephalus aceratus TaxID=36190 RepID=A0ACB9WHA6_CHAAC|nr:hypothetical protein KUCAC02_024208 [Chaenocephalus aceratus]
MLHSVVMTAERRAENVWKKVLTQARQDKPQDEQTPEEPACIRRPETDQCFGAPTGLPSGRTRLPRSQGSKGGKPLELWTEQDSLNEIERGPHKRCHPLFGLHRRVRLPRLYLGKGCMDESGCSCLPLVSSSPRPFHVPLPLQRTRALCAPSQNVPVHPRCIKVDTSQCCPLCKEKKKLLCLHVRRCRCEPSGEVLCSVASLPSDGVCGPGVRAGTSAVPSARLICTY